MCRMARLAWGGKGDLAVICGSKVKVFNYRDGSTKFSYTTSKEGSHCERSEDGSSQQMGDSTALGHCLLCCFSCSGSLFALCSDDKTLVLWNTTTWECLSTRKLIKRPTAITFDQKEDCIIVADKGGDVYSFSVKSQEAGSLVLGHVSMILDMVITRDDKFIVTADRDEKIRVSLYPNAYNIACYCLGHTDFVSALVLVPTSPDLLVSGSGDGSLTFWDYEQGKMTHSINITNENGNQKDPEDLSSIVTCLACCQKNRVISVVLDRSCQICMYHVNKENAIRKLPSLECEAPPWHVSFDPQGRLWTTQPFPEDPVPIFEPQSATDDKSFRYCRVRNCQLPLLQAASDWSFLKECVGKESNLSLLRKKEFDNVAEYLAKKEKRLKGTNPEPKTEPFQDSSTSERQLKRVKLQT